jgi:hypothetical protein
MDVDRVRHHGVVDELPDFRCPQPNDLVIRHRRAFHAPAIHVTVPQAHPCRMPIPGSQIAAPGVYRGDELSTTPGMGWVTPSS